MLRRILLLLINLIFGFQAHEADAPYLYYYSDVLNAFVIERADGTDSRALGAGLMSADRTNWITQVGWSASGKWMTWASGTTGGGGRSGLWGWIVSVDGTKRLDVIEEPLSTEQMVWSPTEDVLAVLTTSGNSGSALYLIDAETGSVIKKLEIEVSPEGIGRIEWTDDGEQIRFFTFQTVSTADGFEYRKRLTRVTRTGEATSEEVAEIDEPEPFAFQPEAGYEVEHIVWDEAEKNALVFSRTECRECGYRLDWYSSDSQQVQHIAADVDYGDHESIYQMGWSPDNRHIVYYTTENELMLFDTETRDRTAITDDSSGKWIWSEQGDRLVYQDNTDYQLFLHYVPSGENVNLGFERWFGARFSPDGQSLAVDSQGPSIMNLTSWDVWEIPDHSSAVYAAQYGDLFRWSPDSEWLISSPVHFHSSGGGGPRAVMVVKRDQRVRRELSVYYGTPGWLPERVIPHLAPGQAESVVLHPSMTLTHTDVVKGLAWDISGDRLVTLTPNVLHFWNADDGTKIRSITVEGLNDTLCNSTFYEACFMTWREDGIRVNRTLYDAENGEILEAGSGDSFQPNRMRYSSDGKQAAQVVDDSVVITDVDSETVVAQIPMTDVWQVIWRDDYLFIAAKEYFVWNTHTQTLLPLKNSDNVSVRNIAISPDGRWLVSASVFDRIHLWDLSGGDYVRELNLNANTLVFSPDGRWLAVSGSSMVTLWDVEKVTGSE